MDINEFLNRYGTSTHAEMFRLILEQTSLSEAARVEARRLINSLEDMLKHEYQKFR